jgi:hypothetical protein
VRDTLGLIDGDAHEAMRPAALYLYLDNLHAFGLRYPLRDLFDFGRYRGLHRSIWLEPTKKWAFAHWVDSTFQNYCSTGAGDSFIVVARGVRDIKGTVRSVSFFVAVNLA